MEYRQDLDSLKGIAIIAVVLFHMGLLESGYLGVDIFFVINGFLLIPTVCRAIANSDFSFYNFIQKRVVRLLPLIVLASAFSLILGYFLMLPDDYENVSQTVIASNVFSENILSLITTNYWDVQTGYKPLMHLWYVGVLFEFYIILPLVLIFISTLAVSFKKDKMQYMIYTITILAIISVVLYIAPIASQSSKFYLLPFRFFELGVGGIIALYIDNIKKSILQKPTVHSFVSILLVVVISCSLITHALGYNQSTVLVIGMNKSLTNNMPISGSTALLLTVILTGIIIVNNKGDVLLQSKFLAWIGRMTYSIFIWHQVLLAFYRYSISSKVTLSFVLGFLVVTMTISILSYYLIEKRIKVSNKSFFVWSFVAVLVIVPAGYLYLHAGVVRNIPELDVVKGQEHRGQFAEYCDRVYQYKNYPIKNGKLNVLVVGVSFGRDFANILLESKYRDSINLVYGYTWDEKGLDEKVSQSDYIFSFSSPDVLPAFVHEEKKTDCKIMGIGTKNYGSCNGIIYKNRTSADYFKQVAEIEDYGYILLNEQWKKAWGEKNYIDLLTPAMIDQEHVRVFTDDNRYISQDCRHLTPAGAQWYARILDWENIFQK